MAARSACPTTPPHRGGVLFPGGRRCRRAAAAAGGLAGAPLDPALLPTCAAYVHAC